MKGNKKIDRVEKELVEQYRQSRKSLPETGDGWRENVVSAIAGIELLPGVRADVGRARRSLGLEFLQPSLLLRFSSAAALASILMVVLYFVLGSSYKPAPSIELLLDPILSIGSEWLKGV